MKMEQQLDQEPIQKLLIHRVVHVNERISLEIRPLLLKQVFIYFIHFSKLLTVLRFSEFSKSHYPNITIIQSLSKSIHTPENRIQVKWFHFHW